MTSSCAASCSTPTLPPVITRNRQDPCSGATIHTRSGPEPMSCFNGGPGVSDLYLPRENLIFCCFRLHWRRHSRHVRSSLALLISILQTQTPLPCSSLLCNQLSAADLTAQFAFRLPLTTTATTQTSKLVQQLSWPPFLPAPHLHVPLTRNRKMLHLLRPGPFTSKCTLKAARAAQAIVVFLRRSHARHVAHSWRYQCPLHPPPHQPFTLTTPQPTRCLTPTSLMTVELRAIAAAFPLDRHQSHRSHKHEKKPFAANATAPNSKSRAEFRLSRCIVITNAQLPPRCFRHLRRAEMAQRGVAPDAAPMPCTMLGKRVTGLYSERMRSRAAPVRCAGQACDVRCSSSGKEGVGWPFVAAYRLPWHLR